MAIKKPISKIKVKPLLKVSDQIAMGQPILPSDAELIFQFKFSNNKSKTLDILVKIALPGSIILGMTQASFPQFYIDFTGQLPSWTNMSNNLLAAVDYIWGIIGKPVKQNNIIYHIPNFILYSFGVFGIKKMFEFVRRKTWLDKVLSAKTILEKNIEKGIQSYKMHEGHSLLFIGKGDFIGEQFCINSNINDILTLSSIKPTYSNHWIKYDINNSYTYLENAILKCDLSSSGEYILFPVKDTELFLPGEKEYDVAPEKVEILIHNIRDVENVNKINPKRIVIVGDRNQITSVRTENKTGILENTIENISLTSIDKDLRKVTILDASDLVLKTILHLFPSCKILLRTSIEGSKVYKNRFYERLSELGYDDDKEYTQQITVGYDIHEEQVERESFRTKLENYLPIILSKNTKDALLRKGFKSNQFIYVPDLVIAELKKIAQSF